MASLYESVKNKRREVREASRKANEVMKELAQTNYDLESLFHFDDLGVPCTDSDKSLLLLKQKRRLETALKKSMREVDTKRAELHELQEAERLSASTGEIWRPVNIKGGAYERFYEISNKGNIRSYRKGKWGVQDKPKMLSPDNGVYRKIVLVDESGEHTMYTIHSLVANAFIPNPNGYRYVNHIDGNKKNNNADNLEWCTHKQNMEHASKHGLMYSKPIRELATGEVFPSILEAARQKGCNPSRIYANLSGYRGNKKGDSLYEYVI